MAANVGGIKIDTSKLDQITAEMKPKASQKVRKFGLLITASIMKRAPRVTGNYIGTISSNSKLIAPLTFRVQDGTEYGLRLELGFVGQDKLGRTYNQAPRPHFVPAIEEYRQAFLDDFSELFK